MIRIGKSECRCRQCGSITQLEWEIESTISYDHEHGMGEETEYDCVAEEICPGCGREITAHMSIYEYPVGVLETTTDICVNEDVADVEMPQIYFYDL